MDLKDFIHTALIDIAAGVQKAAVDTRELVAIAPGRVEGREVIIESDVEFDIAVTVSSQSETRKLGGGNASGKLKVVAIDIELGAKGEAEKKMDSRKEEISRIKFKVPIRFNAHFRHDPNGIALASETRAALDRLEASRLT